MKTYKTRYYTLCRGRKADDPSGNLRQFDDIVYIQCTNTSKVEVLLEKHFKKPTPSGLFFVPVITQITAIEGHCICEQGDLE